LPSWLSGWSYRKSHEIEGSTAAQTDYQIKITVHYESGADSGEDVYLNGKCRTDFGDIRITDSDGVTVLAGENNGWIEDKVDGDYAIVWFKVPSIPASPDIKTIYIYYGNPDASFIGNGENTFMFFDHFEGTSLDTNKWSTTQESGSGGSVTVSNSEVDIQSGLGSSSVPAVFRVQSLQSFSGSLKLRAKKRYPNWGGLGSAGYYRGADTQFWTGDEPSPDTPIASYGTGWEVDENYYAGFNYNPSGAERTANSSSAENDKKYELRYVEDTKSVYIIDEVELGTLSTNNPSPPFYVLFRVRNWQDTYPQGRVVCDWIFVAKYVDPEPSHGVWGSEEIPAFSVSVLNESLDKSRGIAGEKVTYTATVQDENGDALPSTFKVTLKIDGTILIQDQPLTSDVYDPATKKLTLQWTVPSMSTFHTVKISWSEQTIDTTTYLDGESTGVEFEIISIPPTLTSEQMHSISLTLIVCLVFISFETAKEMAENMV